MSTEVGIYLKVIRSSLDAWRSQAGGLGTTTKMTVMENLDISSETSPRGEEIDLLDHSALIQDMNRSDKLSLEERAKKARKNRRQQLKLFMQYDRAEEERTTKTEGNRSVTISFPHDVELMDAAAKGSVEDMRQLLENGLDANAKNQEGLTALHNSCIDGNPEMVKLLLKHGASVNVSDKDGWTPLHAAATCGYPDVVKSLIAAGADLLALNGDGDMPYDIADDEETLGIIEDAMRKNGITNETIEEKRTELHTVILADVKALIEENENLNMPVNEEGATLLHVAIANNCNDVVELLLDSGASVDTEDVEGWKPVHAAAFFNNNEALEMLVMKKQADLRATTDSGFEPLDLADQPVTRKNILTLMDADPNKYKVENKKPIERGSTTPNVLKEVETNLLFEDETTFDNKTDTILPVMGESEDNDAEGQVNTSLDDHNDFMPVLKRVESISTKRNSMREAKKQAPTMKSSNFTRKESIDLYDNSYDLLLTKKKTDQPKPNNNASNDTNISPVQTLGKIYENDDRIEDLNPADYIKEANLGNEVLSSSSEVATRSSNEIPSADEIPKNGAKTQVPTEFNFLETEEKDPPQVFVPPPSTFSVAEDEPVVLQTSPFEATNSPNLNDQRNDLMLPSETTSTASTTQGEDFLVELRRAIGTRAVSSNEQNTTDLYESDTPSESTLKKDPETTSPSENGVQSASSNGDLFPTSVKVSDPITDIGQDKDTFSKTMSGNRTQAESFHEKENKFEDRNASPTFSPYETASSGSHFYENVYDETPSKKNDNSEVKVTQPNSVSTKHDNSTYAIVEKTSKDESKTPLEKENKIPTGVNLNDKNNSSSQSADVKSKNHLGMTRDGSQTINDKKTISLDQDKDKDNNNTIPASPPPVPPRKKFEPLVDKRKHATEPVRPGTLQDLKLKRQKSRQTLILDGNDLSPVIPRGIESMVFRNLEQTPSSEKVFRPPDSPTTNRKVFRAPALSKDVSIITQKKRCTIM